MLTLENVMSVESCGMWRSSLLYVGQTSVPAEKQALISGQSGNSWFLISNTKHRKWIIKSYQATFCCEIKFYLLKKCEKFKRNHNTTFSVVQAMNRHSNNLYINENISVSLHMHFQKVNFLFLLTKRKENLSQFILTHYTI